MKLLKALLARNTLEKSGNEGATNSALETLVLVTPKRPRRQLQMMWSVREIRGRG